MKIRVHLDLDGDCFISPDSVFGVEIDPQLYADYKDAERRFLCLQSKIIQKFQEG